ncbi:MAG TPA: PA0069 family radical SAM protein [Burkholderiaceae bacterium]|nr:PA0069 family radical SAM protein [Burkholderiaceae bacterium]
MQGVPIKGRGSLSNHDSRFAAFTREAFLDDWSPYGVAANPSELPAEFPPEVVPEARPPTTVSTERARSIISRNTSPDIPFDQSVNAYRGCEHGCIYCYARPSHAYLDLSPGLDFETRLYAKTNAPEVLRKELSRPGYVPQHIAMGTNTDPYQPIERRLRITAALLEVFDEFNHPVSITTKSTLITRDIPLLARLARRNLVRVFISLGTLNRELARRMEPRAATPGARLEAVRALRQAGVPVGVLIAPVIPALNDHELERVAIAAAEAGAIDASYILLRLPREVAGLFQEWLQAHYPLKAAHVMNLMRAMRGGQEYDADFRHRMRGQGVHAQMLRQRFARICARTGLNTRRIELDTTAFQPPGRARQLGLF